VIKEDIDKNLENITRIIKRANITKNFALVFAECDSLEKQEKYVGGLCQRCRQEGIVLTEVKLLDSPPIIRLFEVIKEHLEKEFGNALPEKLGIQVTGLELSILLDEDEQAPAVLQILNMNRERYYNDLPFPFVFWMPKYACIKVANVAQDFWAYRVGTPTFCHDEITGPSLPENMEEGKDITVWQDKAAQIPVLERLINTHPLTEVLVNLLIKSGEAYAYIGYTEKARQKYEQAIEENKKNNGDPEWAAEAYNKLGIIYSDMGEGKEYLVKAVKSLKDYLEIVGPTGRTDRLTRGYNHLGLVYDRHKRYDQAIESYERALQISRNYGYRKEEGDILGNIGLMYRKQEKFDDALKMHQQALTISRELDDIQSEALDLSNIGLIYYEQNAYKDAIDYFNNALFLNVKTGNKLEEMKQLILLGDTWKAMGDFSKALETYLSAKSIAEEININIFAVFDKLTALFSPDAFDDTGQGILLLKEAIEKSQYPKKTNKELHYWRKLCDLYRIRNEFIEKNNCLMHMAGILDKRSRQSKDRYEKIGYYEELMKIYIELDKKKEARTCRQILEDLYYLKIIAWFTSEVDIKDRRPILRVGKTYNLYLQIVQTLPKHPLIYQKKIPPFKKEQKISNFSEPLPLEGRRISEEKVSPVEATNKSDKILKEKDKNTTLKGRMGTGLNEKSNQPAIYNNKQDYYIPIEQERKEKIYKISAPSPPPYMSDPFTTVVSFHLKSPGIGFDRTTLDVLLSENNISDFGCVTITPKSIGNHRISVRVRAKTAGYKNDIVIPLPLALKSITYREAVEYDIKEYQKDEKLKTYIELNALHQDSTPLGHLFDAVDEAVDNGKSIAIIGEFGAGKTTFARYYEYKKKCEWIENPHKSRLVLFLDLNEYSGMKYTMTMDKWIIDNIKHKIDFDIKRKEFEKYLNEKKLLLIFDGLDEVANIQGEDAINRDMHKINKIARKGSTVIITIRKSFLEPEVDQRNLKNFIWLYIDDLNIQQIIDFVRKKIPVGWQNFIEFVFGKKERADLYRKFEKNKEDNNNLSGLVRKPLFLDMMIDAYQRSHLNLGSIYNPADLYEVLTNDWISKEIEKKETSIKSGEMRQIIRELAFKMFLDNQFSYTYGELYQIIHSILDKISITLKQNFDYYAVMKDITNASFLVRDKVWKNSFAFPHRSFVEYFTANKFAAELKEENTDNFSIRILYEEIFEFLGWIMREEGNKDEDLRKVLGDPKFPFKARVNAIPPLRKQRNKKAIKPLFDAHTDIESSHPLLRFVCGYTLGIFQEEFPEEFKSQEFKERLVAAHKKEKNSLIRLRMALLLTEGEYKQFEFEELNPDYEFLSSSLDEILEPSGTIEAYDKILKVNREHHIVLEESIRILTIYVTFNAEAVKFRNTLLRYIFKFGYNHKSEKIQRISLWSIDKLGLLFDPKDKNSETLKIRTKAGRIVVNSLKYKPPFVQEMAKNIIAKYPEYFILRNLINPKH
jgi:tetratricopeptide (TPR) repeat protein